MTFSLFLPNAAKPRSNCTAGGGLGPLRRFFQFFRGWLAAAPTGARAAATHDETRAPLLGLPAEFNCPEYPFCGCPGGAVRPECPDLKEQRQVGGWHDE
jgi:hypothetical protein